MSDKKSDEGVRKLTDDFEFHHKDAGKPSIIHVILLNRTLRILCALGIFCMLIPILDYFYFYSTEIAEYQIDDSGICSHYPIYQIPCGGSENITESECIANACCFSTKTGCYHFLPSKYQLKAERPWSSSLKDFFLSPTKAMSPLSTRAFTTMKLDIQEVSGEILSIFLWNPKLSTHNTSRMTMKDSSISSKYDIKVFSPDLFIEVKRKIDNRTIFSTARGALIASENYFELSIFMGGSSVELMGFDTTHLSEGQRILINNAHSSIMPYVVAYDRDSKYYHAVHFESIDSPAEIQILKSNTIIIRQYHSTSFRMKVFTGPKYVDVYGQLKSFISHYFPIGFWPFGIHISRSNAMYNETETRIELNYLLTNINSIPFDSHCIDAELSSLIMSSANDSENLFMGYEKVIDELRQNNKKFLLHMSLSAIEVTTLTANENDVDARPFEDDKLFLKDIDGITNFVGIYGKTRKVFYFDYITKSTEIAESLMSQWKRLQQKYKQLADGIFLYRSYPADDTANKSMKYLETFNFKPKNFQNEIQHLIPLNLMLKNGELLIHQLNNYGRKVIEVFGETINDDDDKRKFCITDSYREPASSTDGLCGMLMRMAEKPSWTNFQSTIHKSVFYSLIGMSFYGAEVCGSNYINIAEDLCIRWYQFAIFMPLFYVNSHKMPTKFTKYAERIMVHAIRTRYALLSYMRTCIMMKMPLLRPMRYAYPEILDIDDAEIELISNHQLMFGDSLMIAPINEPLVVELDLYFPEKFFELWSGVEMPQNTTHFSIVMNDIPIFIRAGHIIALNLAHESISASQARLQPYLLIVALSCTERFSCIAHGRQHIVGGVEFKFEASETYLNVTVITSTAIDDEDGNPSEGRNAICGPEPFASSEFRLAKIYGLGEFKEKYRNDYLSLDLNICDADWNETFSILI